MKTASAALAMVVSLLSSVPALSASVNLRTATGITVRVGYEVEYVYRGSNKPSYIWTISPLTFTAVGIPAGSRARIVFVNNVKTLYNCGSATGGVTEHVYYVDLGSAGDTMVGDLLAEGQKESPMGPVAATSYPPFTRYEPYCFTYQSIGQSISLVVDGVWQATDLDTSTAKFLLNLER